MKMNEREVCGYLHDLRNNSCGDISAAEAIVLARKKYNLEPEEVRRLCRTNGVLTEDLIAYEV